MKKGLAFSGICALLVVAASPGARADNKPPAPNLPTPAAPAMQAPPAPPAYVPPIDSNNSGADGDAEMVLQETEQLDAQRRLRAQISAFDTAQQQQAYDNDWMLRDYTAALKADGLALPTGIDDSLVKAPGKNGAPSLQDDPLMPHPRENQPAAQPNPSENSSNLKELAPTSMLAPLGMTPLLPPLANAGKPARDPWAFVSSPDTDYPMADNAAAINATAVPGRDPRTSDSLNFLDTPGATAQQDGLITPSTDSLMSLQDPLPDQDPVPVKPKVNPRNNFLVPTAPTNDVTEFFKKQADALNPPAAPNAPLPFVAAKPYVPPKNPFPLAKPVVNPGMRSHVDDPFDLLHR